MHPTHAITIAQAMPDEGRFVLLAALAAGLLLWLVGGKVIRPTFALLGMTAGAFVGLVFVPMTGLTPLDIAGVVFGPTTIGLIVGSLLGLLAAMLLFRAVMAVSSSVVFAAVGALGGLVYIQHAPNAGHDVTPAMVAAGQSAGDTADTLAGSTDEWRDTAAQAASEFVARHTDILDAPTPSDGVDPLWTEDQADAATQQIADAAARSKAFITHVSTVARAEWDTHDSQEQFVVGASTLAGLAAGLLFGIMMPKRSAALVTALLGSAVWMSASLSMLQTRGTMPSFLNQPPTFWAIAWALVAIVGVSIQMGALKKLRRPKLELIEPEDD